MTTLKTSTSTVSKMKAIEVDRDGLIKKFLVDDEDLTTSLTKRNLLTALSLGQISFTKFLALWRENT